MSNPVSEQSITPDRAELARKTDLVARPVGPAAVNDLFAELEKYDEAERAETFEHLKRALNETRASVGAEPAGMSKLILLDSGPLGIISNPTETQTVITCRESQKDNRRREM